jgi:hypothetical protein
MENKIVAKIKGSTWTSISFVIKDAESLGKLFKMLEGMNVVESRGFSLADGYKSVNYEDVPVSLSIESSVLIHTEKELEELARLEKAHTEAEGAMKEAEHPTKVSEEPTD